MAFAHAAAAHRDAVVLVPEEEETISTIHLSVRRYVNTRLQDEYVQLGLRGRTECSAVMRAVSIFVFSARANDS